MSRPNERKKSVVIVEDHPMFRERLAELINRESDLVVCGEADNIRDGFELITRGGAEVAIIDITLQGSSGLELLKNLKAAGVEIPVLVLSMHDETLYAERVLRAGARGYITKSEASAKIMTALRKVLSGEIYLSSKMATKLLGQIAGGGSGPATGLGRLTDRELEVFNLIGRGQTTREISEALNLGAATVETYRARIKDKLHLENGARLQQEALRWVQSAERAAA
ncbi:MAG TPA: response regulator transcription factor [Chthoniobacterales bacterium]